MVLFLDKNLLQQSFSFGWYEFIKEIFCTYSVHFGLMSIQSTLCYFLFTHKLTSVKHTFVNLKYSTQNRLLKVKQSSACVNQRDWEERGFAWWLCRKLYLPTEASQFLSRGGFHRKVACWETLPLPASLYSSGGLGKALFAGVGRQDEAE